MIRLFSSFDFFIFYWSFFIMTIIFSLLLNKTFVLSSRNGNTLILNNLSSFFYSLKPLQFNKFNLVIGFRVFRLIFGLNFFSVFSYSFPFTSQFGPILLFAVCTCLSLVLFNFFRNFGGFASHFIPEGSPLGLSFFLFLIELVRNLIRPITLAVRLVANILAGHLLIILLSKIVFIFSPFVLFYYFLNIVEFFVRLIQSYIFCTIITLYLSEIH